MIKWIKMPDYDYVSISGFHFYRTGKQVMVVKGEESFYLPEGGRATDRIEAFLREEKMKRTACIVCGGPVKQAGKFRTILYCSLTCRNKAYENFYDLTCQHCGKEFKAHKKKQKYCSVECNGQAHKKVTLHAMD